jgi:hypothetical protein
MSAMKTYDMTWRDMTLLKVKTESEKKTKKKQYMNGTLTQTRWGEMQERQEKKGRSKERT